MYKNIHLLIFIALTLLSCTKNADKDGAVLEIRTTSESIMADGTDKAELSAYLDGELLEEAQIYCATTNEFFDSPYVFTTRRPGNYKFSAIKGTEMSEPVVIKAGSGDIRMFRRKELVLEYTYTMCPNCPSMVSKLDIVAEEIPDTFEIVAVHLSAQADPMYSGFGDAIFDHFGATGAPNLTIGFRQTTSNISAASIKSFIQANIEEFPADAGMKFSSTVKDGKLSVRMDMKFNITGEYSYGIILVENNITKYPQAGTSDPDFTHNHVLRGWIKDDSGTIAIRGVEIGERVSGEEFSADYIFELGPDWDTSNLQIVGFVCNADDKGNFYVNNTASAKAGETTEYDYE